MFREFINQYLLEPFVRPEIKKIALTILEKGEINLFRTGYFYNSYRLGRDFFDFNLTHKHYLIKLNPFEEMWAGHLIITKIRERELEEERKIFEEAVKEIES